MEKIPTAHDALDGGIFCLCGAPSTDLTAALRSTATSHSSIPSMRDHPSCTVRMVQVGWITPNVRYIRCLRGIACNSHIRCNCVSVWLRLTHCIMYAWHCMCVHECHVSANNILTSAHSPWVWLHVFHKFVITKNPFGSYTMACIILFWGQLKRYIYKFKIHQWWNNKVCHIKRNISDWITTVLCVVAIATVVVPRSLQLGGESTVHRASLLVALLISKTIAALRMYEGE